MGKITVVLVFVTILFLTGILLFSYKETRIIPGPPIPKSPKASIPQKTPISQRATLTGVYVCLPHSDKSGPQTMECEFGIKTDDGNYFALSMDQAMLENFEADKKVIAEGLLVPIEAISSDHWRKYNIKGIMEVEKITQGI